MYAVLKLLKKAESEIGEGSKILYFFHKRKF